MNKQKGFISIIVILIIVALSVWYMVNILDAQYSSSKKSSVELNSEPTDITNAVQKTKNLKDALEGTNNRLNGELEGI